MKKEQKAKSSMLTSLLNVSKKGKIRRAGIHERMIVGIERPELKGETHLFLDFRRLRHHPINAHTLPSESPPVRISLSGRTAPRPGR